MSERDTLSHVQQFLDRYHAFKVAFADTPEGKRRNPWQFSMSSLLLRQAMNADAIAELVKLGRPHAAYMAVRNSYEVYLQMLLLGYAEKPIPKNRRNPVERRFTRQMLAVRFMRFPQHIHEQNVTEVSNELALARVGMRKLDVSLGDAIKRRRRIGEKVKKSRRIHNWTESTYDWLPFHNLGQLRSYLWPKGGNPIMPPKAGPPSERRWNHLHVMCYRIPSQYLHASPYSLTNTYNFQEGWLTDQRTGTIDESPLAAIHMLGWFSLFSFADTMGVRHLYDLVEPMGL